MQIAPLWFALMQVGVVNAPMQTLARPAPPPRTHAHVHNHDHNHNHNHDHDAAAPSQPGRA